MKQRLLTLLTLVLCVCSGAWATEETISLATYTVTEGVATLTSTSGNATVILSRNGGNADGAASNSRGFRWQKTRVITVNVADGYKINSVKLTSNKNGNNLGDIQYTLTDGSNSLSGSWDYALTSGKQDAYTWSATAGTAYTDWVLTNSGTNGDIYVASVTVSYEVYTPTNTAPTILTQPATTLTAYVGAEASLSVSASGYPTPSYQWYSNTTASNEGGTAIDGATSGTYTFTPSATGTYYYYAVATNTYDNEDHSATSNVSSVTVKERGLISYATDDAEAISIPLASTYYEKNSAITLPSVNRYFYKEGYSVSKWSDGSSDYALGGSYTVTNDATIAPVFTANTKALGDEETTITWTFATDNGAPIYTIEGENKTTAVIGTTANGIDLKMDVLTTKNGSDVGKFNNSSYPDKAQVNKYTQFTIPAMKGMVVNYTTTNGTPETTDAVLFGSDNATSISGQNYVYTYTGSESTLTIYDNQSALYPSGITVTYPVRQSIYATPSITVGDFNFANKGYAVTITASEGTLQVSTDGTTYAEQTSPYTTYASTTTTYYAKATGNDYDDSEVASQEVTNTFDSSKSYVAWVYTKGYGVTNYAFTTDPMVTALQSIYNVVEVNYAETVTPSEDLSNADLIVCSEAMAGNKTMSNGMKVFAGQTPMISLKFFNYTSGRWGWGTPANPSTTTLGFTPNSTLYKVLDGVTYESDGTIKLATQSYNTGNQKNVVQTVSEWTDSAPSDNVNMGTADEKVAMHCATKYFGLGLSSDCWQYYTDNAKTIVKNAAAMLIAGEDLSSISATMKCTAGKYGTFAAPFAVTIPEGVTAYSVTANNENTAIALTKVAEAGATLDAGTPVLIYSENGLDETKLYGVATVETETCSNGILYGALQSGQTIPSGSYVLQTQEGVQQFYKLTNSVKSNVNRCWIQLSAEPAAKASLAIAPDDVTGVKSVSANAKNAPMKRIVNGQLVIEKDGKQYNAMGQEK